jgi:predicted  nucleic acid-binding Zn ribbon protein
MMFVAELTFDIPEACNIDRLSQLIKSLLGTLRMNGQVCGREWPIARTALCCSTIVLIPAHDALDSTHQNSYVKDALDQLVVNGIGEPQIALIGEDIDGTDKCTCEKLASYILYTNYLSLESPVRCGDCFCPIPLYTLPHTYDDEFNDVISWQSNYQACDLLQMNCAVLERATARQLSRLDSQLSHDGLAICERIAAATSIPTYYYLYRYGSRSRAAELARRCPSCGGAWLLEKPWHRFDFRCTQCNLVSNIAWDVR